MLAPQVSFVLHTADPLTGADGARNSVYAELAPGLGETLASGAEGSAWRMSIGKSDAELTLHSFANFSEAYLPVTGEPRGVQPGSSIYVASQDKVKGEGAGAASKAGTVALRTVDYSKQELSVSGDARKALAKQLAEVGVVVEDEFGAAQDVEGCVMGGSVYVVQSRPQP
jgi:phosphoglucan, water dikinase